MKRHRDVKNLHQSHIEEATVLQNTSIWGATAMSSTYSRAT